MSNLRVWQKLLIMGVVLMVPFGVVSYTMVNSVNVLGIEFTKQEVRGLEYYPAVNALLKDLQLHREQADAVLLGDATLKTALTATAAEIESDIKRVDDVDKRLGEPLRTTKQWAAVRAASRDVVGRTLSLSTDESFDRHTRVIAETLEFIAQLGDSSNLNQDADISRGHLIHMVLEDGPQLTESLAYARDLGIGIAAGHNRSAAQLETLHRTSIIAAHLAADIDRSAAKAFDAGASAKAQLQSASNATTAAVVDAMTEVGKLAGQKTVETPGAFSASLTRSIDSVYQLEDKTTSVLAASLNDRIGALRRDLLVMLGWALLGLAVVIGFGIFVMLDITTTLRTLVALANQIAIGDLPSLDGVTKRKDEIGIVSQAFARMVTALKETVAMTEHIARGNLAVCINPRSEQDVMAHALAEMVDRLAVLVGEVQQSGIQVNASVNQIAATAKQQQATATEIAATTLQIGATSKEIAATSKELVKTMAEVSSVAEESATLAGSGQAGLTRMEETMRRVMDAAGAINAKLGVLNQKATNINQVVTTITKVADQTNLLSLNAAIEAEKAGEYGRGFAVVATEIRRLADQTAVATYDIDQMVKEIQTAVTAGVMGMDKFGEEVRRGMQDVQQVSEQLSQIIHQVQLLAPRFDTVSEGMQTQAVGAEQITQALAQLSDAAQQTVDSLRQSNQAIEGLHQTAAGMRQGVARFKLVA